MVVDDIFEFQLFSTLFNKQVLNVFHYQLTALTGTVTLGELSLAFWTHIAAELRALTTTEIAYNRIDYLNIGNEAEFGTTSLANVTGDQVADTLPPFFVATFRYFRATRAVRSGYKRFAGISEGAITDGAATSAFLTLTYALSDELDDSITYTNLANSATIKPVILSRVLNGQPRPTPVAFDITSVDFTHFGTQNTRK